MRRFNATVFQDFIIGAGAKANTSSRFDAALGQFDTLALQLVVDSVTGLSGTVDAYIEHSANGRHWKDKGSVAACSALAIANQTNTATGTDPSGNPSLAFVRLRFELTGSASGARVRCYVTARDQAG